MNIPFLSLGQICLLAFCEKIGRLLGHPPAPVITLSLSDFLELVEPAQILHSLTKSSLLTRVVLVVDDWRDECVVIRLSRPMREYIERETSIRGFAGLSATFLDLVEEAYRHLQTPGRD